MGLTIRTIPERCDSETRRRVGVHAQPMTLTIDYFASQSCPSSARWPFGTQMRNVEP